MAAASAGQWLAVCSAGREEEEEEEEGGAPRLPAALARGWPRGCISWESSATTLQSHVLPKVPGAQVHPLLTRIMMLGNFQSPGGTQSCQ